MRENYNELLDKLVEHFGITRFIKDGGYILPDGRLLDLNRSDMDKKQYHRAIAAFLPQEMHGACDEITIVNLMAVTGVIRYEARGRVHIAAEPTPQQRRKLFEIMKYSVHGYRVIVSAHNGATIGDRMFQSPQAHELLHFFNHCFSAEAKQYREDEFSITEEQSGYIFIFRPEQRRVGHYQSVTDTFIIQPEFNDLLPFFKQQVLERQEVAIAV